MKNKKALKLVSFIAIVCIMLNLFAVISFADDEDLGFIVNVSLANQGELITGYSGIYVEDTDSDGVITVNDVLYCAHENFFEEGAAAYETETTKWGLSIKKMCGVENGGSYGYYINNQMAWSLLDEVKENDHVYAFVYKDAENYSDSYSYFDKEMVVTSPDDELTLTLTKMGFDYDGNTVLSPVANAIITIDWKDTEYKTDENGVVTIPKFDSDGLFMVSARSEDEIIAPPVCLVNVLKADIFVTIANQGDLVVKYEEISVKDVDGDNMLTVNDALIIAHRDFVEGGESAYETEETQWGLSIKKMCGVENGGSYGYYINNEMAYGLTDPVTDGDHLYAFVYKDAENFTDKYSFFDKNTVEASEDDEITLTLIKNDFDENWNPVQAPVKNAIITVDGVETEYKTDENGVVKIKLSKGDHVISAVSKDDIIAPPILLATITEGAPAAGEEPAVVPSSTSVDVEIPKTGVASNGVSCAVFTVCTLAAFAVLAKKKDEE